VPKDVTDPVLTLGVYSDVFTQIGMVTLGITVLMAATVPLLNKLINKSDEVEENAEVALQK
jgi:POT family proton-dependent oligopeptide transporter